MRLGVWVRQENMELTQQWIWSLENSCQKGYHSLNLNCTSLRYFRTSEWYNVAFLGSLSYLFCGGCLHFLGGSNGGRVYCQVKKEWRSHIILVDPSLYSPLIGLESNVYKEALILCGWDNDERALVDFHEYPINFARNLVPSEEMALSLTRK